MRSKSCICCRTIFRHGLIYTWCSCRGRVMLQKNWVHTSCSTTSEGKRVYDWSKRAYLKVFSWDLLTIRHLGLFIVLVCHFWINFSYYLLVISPHVSGSPRPHWSECRYLPSSWPQGCPALGSNRRRSSLQADKQKTESFYTAVTSSVSADFLLQGDALEHHSQSICFSWLDRGREEEPPQQLWSSSPPQPTHHKF